MGTRVTLTCTQNLCFVQKKIMKNIIFTKFKNRYILHRACLRNEQMLPTMHIVTGLYGSSEFGHCGFQGHADFPLTIKVPNRIFSVLPGLNVAVSSVCIKVKFYELRHCALSFVGKHTKTDFLTNHLHFQIVDDHFGRQRNPIL